MKQHPIQLKTIQIQESSFKFQKDGKNKKHENPQFELGSGASEVEDNGNFTVGLRFRTKNKATATYSVTVELIGVFSASEGVKKNQIRHFIKNNAKYILLPFLRNYVFDLTSRMRVHPFIIPLMEIPREAMSQDNF